MGRRMTWIGDESHYTLSTENTQSSLTCFGFFLGDFLFYFHFGIAADKVKLAKSHINKNFMAFFFSVFKFKSRLECAATCRLMLSTENWVLFWLVWLFLFHIFVFVRDDSTFRWWIYRRHMATLCGSAKFITRYYADGAIHLLFGMH